MFVPLQWLNRGARHFFHANPYYNEYRIQFYMRFTGARDLNSCHRTLFTFLRRQYKSVKSRMTVLSHNIFQFKDPGPFGWQFINRDTW